jgi:hypothetical protein
VLAERAGAAEQLRLLDARAGQPVVVDLQGLGGGLSRSQISATVNQLKALYSTVASSRSPCALTLAGLQPESQEPEPEPEPDGGAHHPSNKADGSLLAALAAMRAEAWRGVAHAQDKRPCDLHDAADLIYIDALAPASLDELPRWTEPGAVLVLRPDVPDLEPPPLPAAAQTARLPLEVLLPPAVAGKPLKRTRAHSTAMQMQVVAAALDYHQSCGGCWATALAAALPPSKQRALLAPFRQRYVDGGVPIDSHPLLVASAASAASATASAPPPAAASLLPEPPPAAAAAVLPMVSALCVTNLRSIPLLRRAVACYQQQDWPAERRELLLLYDSASPAAAAVAKEWGGGESGRHSAGGVRLMAIEEGDRTLGELRQLSVEAAIGEYIVQWDDDDWYHPLRISRQYEAIIAARAGQQQGQGQGQGDGGEGDCVASMMREWLLVIRRPDASAPAAPAAAMDGDGDGDGDDGVVCCSPWWPGSIMCQTDRMPAYTAERKGEDTRVAQQLVSSGGLGRGLSVACMSGTAGLYVYEHHGEASANTWGRKHFDSLIKSYAVARCSAMRMREELGYVP